MKLFTAEQMRAADAAAAAAGMRPGLLMEAAGRAVAEHARRELPSARRALVLCGKGNNGGDGYVAARFLAAAGVAPTVLELGATPSGEDARTARAALRAHGIEPSALNAEAVRAALASADVVVDALLGSGLDRPLGGRTLEVAQEVNAAGVPVVAVDVPSGVDADVARPPGTVLRARLTVQLAGGKLAGALHPSRALFGRSVVADIGIPAALLEAHGQVSWLEPPLVAAWRPVRPADAYKYSVGTVLVVAGSARYQGAAELACRAAYRGGAGLVTLAAEARMAGGWPEVVWHPLDWGAQDPLAALDALEAKRAGCAVIGPGLDERARPHLAALVARQRGPVVLDAGALEPSGALAEATREHGACVLTPHLGEASRLLGRPTAEVADDPLGSAREVARRFGAVCVLKGATTVVAAADGRSGISTRGHPGMATGGSGDVLAGLLGALLPGGPTFERAALAVVAHGLAGEAAAARFADGLVASDLVDALGPVLADIA